MKETMTEIFKDFLAQKEEQYETFLQKTYEDTYQEAEKGRAVYQEVNDYFDRVETNYADILTYKEKGMSRNKWFEDQLAGYEKQSPGVAAHVVNAMQTSHAETLLDLGAEQKQAPITAPFSGVGKRIMAQAFGQTVTESSYVNVLGTASTFEQMVGATEAEPATKRYFEEKLDSPYDKTFKKVGTAAVIRVKESGKVKFLENKTPTEIAATVDRVYTTAKVGYKIANGDMQASDATDYLIDRTAARVEAGIHMAAKKVGGQLGEKAGAFVGAYFGPAGAAVGGMVGKVVGEMAGEVVAKKVSQGVQKVASVVKDKVGAVANKVGSAISSGLSRLKFW